MEKIDLMQAAQNEYFNQIYVEGRVSSIIKSNDKYFRNFFVKTRDAKGGLHDLRLFVPAKNLSGLTLEKGDHISVNGEIHSHNLENPYVGAKMVVSLFSQDVKKLREEECDDTINQGVFVGYLCKKPFIKHMGDEVITESTLGVTDYKRHRSYKIPFVVYGENAELLKAVCEIGDRVAIGGYFQSRKFPKKIDESLTITKKTFEVAATELEILR